MSKNRYLTGPVSNVRNINPGAIALKIAYTAMLASLGMKYKGKIKIAPRIKKIAARARILRGWFPFHLLGEPPSSRASIKTPK